MPALPLLRRRRERRLAERRQKSERLSRAWVGTGLVLALLAGLLIIGGSLAYASLTAGLPSLDLLPALLDPPNGLLLQPTRIYDRSGTRLLAVLAPQDAPRTYVSSDPGAPEHLPESLLRVTVALVDPALRVHPGYQLDGLTNPDAHPTLAQKLVADLMLWDEPPGLRRALRERILAAQLTSRFGPERLLEWYLNSANFGHSAYGIDAAARLYFGKPAAQLNLAESILLVTVSQSPAINPLDAPQAATQRMQEALIKVQALGLFTEEEINLARFTPLVFQPAPEVTRAAPAFTALALAQLETRFDRARVERGGMLVFTTLDYDLQRSAACAIQTQLARLANQTPQACDSTSPLPPLPPGLSAPEAAASAVVLDPRTGQVLALVGDSKNGTESAFLTPHRPGTLLTPFIYLTGFTRGLSPATLAWDIPQPGSTLANPDGVFHGPLRLRRALANDILVPAGQVFEQMGASLIRQTMLPFGFDTPAASLQELLETDNRASVMDLARAYGIFAAQGSLVGAPTSDGLVPSALLSIRGADGRVYADWSVPQAEQVVSPPLAYLVTDVLGDGTVRTGANFFELGRPVAAKTGFTLDGNDTWAVGYTPQRVAVVWLGGAEGLSTRPAAGLWSALMQSASREVSADGWPQPAGVLRLRVCDPSGMLPTEACPNVVEELFIDGYQPVQADTLYRSYAINRETGFLATVFTPSQLVEDRVYMLVPPEAQDWAVANGMQFPPTSYDTLQPPAPNPQANIAFPPMFAELKGKVVVTGTAAGESFASYRLQAGRGLNPDAWLLIAEGDAPISAGTLAEWDTSGLSGLYALQLVLIRADNSLETVTTQVMVDNESPQVVLDFPREGAVLSLAENLKLTFQPRVSDNLFLESVEMSVDGKRLASFSKEPFSAAWNATRGEHVVRVVARDRMGNETELEVRFTIE